MGCFNNIGFLSNNSIMCGDKCVAFILRKQKSSILKKGIYNINEMDNGVYEPTTFFRPISCPIIGYYDDYGSIENIEINEDTKQFESFFENKFTITDIISIITEHQCDDSIVRNFEKYLGFDRTELVIAIEHYEIFYEMIENIPYTAYKNDDVNKLWLESLGFKCEGTHTDERYNFLYKHSLINGLEIYSDGQFIKCNNKKFEYIYHPYQLVDCINNIYNVDITPSEYLKNCSYFEFYYDNPFYIEDYIDKTIINQYVYNIFDKFTLGFAIANKNDTKIKSRFEVFREAIEKYYKDNNITEPYKDEYNEETSNKILKIDKDLTLKYQKEGYTILESNTIIGYYQLFSKKSICDLLNFNKLMLDLNFYWKPSYYGNQDSFTNERLKFYDICRNICLNRIKNNEED